MLTYYVEYPRDLCNDYSVYATDNRKAFEAAVPGATRITRRQAIRLGWSRPKEAKRDGEQWYGGFYQDGGGSYPEDLDAAIRECAAATDRVLDYREAVAAYALEEGL